MKIINLNVNSLRVRMEAVNRLAADLPPDDMYFQTGKNKNDFLVRLRAKCIWL